MKKIILGLIVALILLVSAILYFRTRSTTVVVSSAKHQEAKPLLEPSLSGELVAPEIAKKRPVAIVIENHPDSRPQSGLFSADIVYEALAEGGITRFLAIYQGHEAGKIGPVRSARPYFADIANEYGALFAHVGGSDEALNGIDKGAWPKLSDANQYFNGDYFDRITSRFAPHNVYTSSQKLQQLMLVHNFSTEANFSAWSFSDKNASDKTAADLVSIDFSSKEFKVTYNFNKTSGLYERSITGKPDKDLETKQVLEPKTVVIQYVKVTPVPNDAKLRVEINLNTGGQSLIFSGGNVVRAQWRKENGRTKFYDESGNEISFSRGQIWVELVPNDLPRVEFSSAAPQTNN